MPSSSEALTAGDWVAVLVVGACAAFCVAFPFAIAPSFAKMFADFGSRELPALTQLGLTTWFPLMLGLNPASVAFYAVSTPKLSLARRRFFLVLACAMGLGAAAVCVVAVYLPVFEVARSIQ